MSINIVVVIGTSNYKAQKWAQANVKGCDRKPICTDSFDVLRGSRYRTVVILPDVEVPEHAQPLLSRNTVITLPKEKRDELK